MGGSRVLHVGGAVADVAVDDDQRRAVLFPLEGLEDAAKDVPREAQPEPLGEDTPRRAEAQVRDLDAFERPPLERALEGRRRAGPPREQERDRLTVEAAGGEGERVGGRTIDPLEVVDGQKDRLVGSERAQRVEQADRDRVGLGRSSRRLGPEERHLQGMELGRRQACELVSTDAVEQVDQRRGREERLGAAPARREDAKAALAGEVDACLPESRLADSRLAREDERPWRAVRLEEGVQRRQLRLAADDSPAPLCRLAHLSCPRG